MHDLQNQLPARTAALVYTGGVSAEAAAVWKQALEIAESLGDAKYQMRSVWGLWAFHGNGIQYQTALTLARRFSGLAATQPSSDDRLVGERMIARRAMDSRPTATTPRTIRRRGRA